MDHLIEKIRSKQADVNQFLNRQKPRNRRLINVAIVCGLIGATFTGVPAVGGTSAIGALKALANWPAPVWQLLCLGATVCTLAATAATTMRNNHDLATRIAKAQIAGAKLEMLEILMESNQIESQQAIEKYGEYCTEVSFL